jgi:tetratricopeptide (TPR) repeat protein
MHKAVVGTVVVAVAVVGLAGAFRRLPPDGTVWHAGSGALRVGGGRVTFVPRWSWRPLAGGPLGCDVAATSREGARVDVRLSVTPPAGRLVLMPGASPGDGLAAALSEAVRERVARIPLACLAGLGGAGCPATPEADVAGAAATRLGLPPAAVTARLEPDRAAVAATRLATLRAAVGRPARRVLVVGWDGADWSLIEPLARAGSMPNLAGLMAAGTWGELESLRPLLSPLIWTTMATGVGPEEHGILDFVEVDPESGAKVPITGRGRRVPALWNLATAAGLDVAVSGWWASWPAEAVDGVVVSDRLFFLLADVVAAAPAGTVVFPPEREAEFRELAERAESETDETVIRALFPVSGDVYRAARAARKGIADPVDGFRRIMVGTRTYFAATLLAAETRPDLTMSYCIGTDEIGHVLAPYLPPPLPGADPGFSEQARIAVERYFAAVDHWLGRLVETCPPSECAILLVSDHGFKWGVGTGRSGATAQQDDRPRDFSGVAAATAALWHRPRGIFVLAGNGVARLGRVRQPPSVYDVAPTVASLLGLPAGESWRGRPLPGAPAATRSPVNWAALAPPSSYLPEVGGARPSPEYVAQLKALGYLEGGEAGAPPAATTAGSGSQATEGELNNLGLVHLEAKRHAEAERAFRAAVATNPRYASPHYNLRRLYFETRRFDEADRELWRAVELGLRDGAGAVARAATDYETAGEPARAVGLLGEATRRFPDDRRLALHRLALLVTTGRCPEAVTAGKETAGRFPEDADVHGFLGLAAACAGDDATARAAFERSLALAPDQPEIRAALAAL